MWASAPSSSRRSDKVGELDCTRHLRAGAVQRGAVEMLAVGRAARCAAGSKRAGAVLVRMQEDSQKEPRWQARWTADSRDTATTTCRRRHLPKWDCRRNGSAARATHFRLPFQRLSLKRRCTHSRSMTHYVSSGAGAGRDTHCGCIFRTEEYMGTMERRKALLHARCRGSAAITAGRTRRARRPPASACPFTTPAGRG